jgi:hypothetical protein
MYFVLANLKIVTSLLAALYLATISLSARAEDLRPEDIVSRHLDSIGPAEVRAGMKSRVVQGSLKFHILVGGGGDVTGTWGRASEQNQSNFVMRFAAGGDWRGEQFVFDGQRTSFATATSSHTRSVFAQFVSSQDFIVKEGLLGGELSTGWALQNLDRTHAKLQSLGHKKIDGRELIGIQYISKASTDLQVKIYFEPDTYRHVMTVYNMDVSATMGREITESVYQHDNRYTIEERFSDFKPVDGLTLPTHYRIQYTQEVQNNATRQADTANMLGTTRVYDWDLTVENIRHNLTLDPANFRVSNRR